MPPAAQAAPAARRCHAASSSRRSDGVAGQGQEHVVEGRAAQGDVVDPDAGLVEVADDLHQASARRRSAGTVSRRVCSSRTDARRRSRAARISHRPRRSRSRSWTTTSIRSPPTCALSSSAVPRAMILPWSTTAIVSASSSASSRYWVVSSSVVPSRTRRADDVPHPEPAARVEAGRRLVEEQQPRPADERAAEVEPAAHAARVRLDHAVGGVGRGRTARAARRRALARLGD